MDNFRTDEYYMRRCIALARRGSGRTSPNPMVGCVIVCDGHIIGEGFHQHYGGPHAEVNAIDSVRNPALLSRSTLYVSLEPCAHFGKTPPCADRIVSLRIPRVVIGSPDPNPLVAGKGAAKLRAVGCEVTEGVLRVACDDLNRFFLCHHLKHRPYVVLKWAQSADGYIDRIRTAETPVGPHWITGEEERRTVHAWRAEMQAVMVGTHTARADNPALTVRCAEVQAGVTLPAPTFYPHPLRIVTDGDLRLPASLQLFDGTAPTWVVTRRSPSAEWTGARAGTTAFRLENNGGGWVESLVELLDKHAVQSLLVEGGTRLLQTFIEEGVWDEARVFSGTCVFGDGLPAPALKDARLTAGQSFARSFLSVYRHA